MTIRYRFFPGWVIVGFMEALVSAATPAQAASLTISGETCVRLARHSPAPDVAYRPGVDVHGKPVAPADVAAAGGFVAPQTLSIPITMDLAPYFGFSRGDRRLKAETQLGTVVYRDGRAWYNGQPLSPDASATLSQICRRRIENRDGPSAPRR